ncbi:hypothetical protein LCGC14_0527530 [marine sediment metagenome]|uniref:Uncharacterized protein n=1 Tax=marine sediment metagenome TaxID=412755 RepID=A0A0F9SF23_9ZZZZ
MNLDIVLIEWIDSKGLTNWEDLEGLEPMPPCICHTVGFLLDDNEEYKTILMTSSETQILGRMTIPSVAIKSIKKLGQSLLDEVKK